MPSFQRAWAMGILLGLTTATRGLAGSLPTELGFDCGIEVQSYEGKRTTIVALPFSLYNFSPALRFGTFASPRIEIEPGLSFFSVNYQGSSVTHLLGSLSLLYHFAEPGSRPRAY